MTPLQDKEARARHKLWGDMNCPVAEAAIPEKEFEKRFLERYCITQVTVQQTGALEHIQRQLKRVFCPACVIVDDALMINKYRALHTSVMDDPMTTFAALALFKCFGCSFEEYHPLASDPRKLIPDMSDFYIKDLQAKYNQHAQQISSQINNQHQQQMIDLLRAQQGQQFAAPPGPKSLYKKFFP